MFILIWELCEYATNDDKAKIAITTALQHETLIRICQCGHKDKTQIHINEEIWGEFDGLETFENFEQGYQLMLDLKKINGKTFENIEEARKEVQKIIKQHKKMEELTRGE